MNRREAIAALVSLPEITRISTAPLKPNDVIVIECDTQLSMPAVEHIKRTIETIWPGRQCIILDRCMTLKVVAK